MNDYGASHDFSKHKRKTRTTEEKEESIRHFRSNDVCDRKIEGIREFLKRTDDDGHNWNNDSEVFRRMVDLTFAYVKIIEHQKEEKEKSKNPVISVMVSKQLRNGN